MAQTEYHWQPRSPNARIVLLSILLFWVFYFALVTLRAALIDFPAQGEMIVRRTYVSLAGIVITLGYWQALKLIDASRLWVRLAAAALLALPAAIAIASINYYFFNLFDPGWLAELEKEMPKGKEPSVLAEILESSISRFFFLLAWAAFYLALGFAENVRAMERRASQFAQAAQASELRALRYQVNPHFLFNALNSLSSLVMTAKPKEAEAMILNLATFYRHSLSGDPTADVALADEIELQRLYLDIEQVRFAGRLSVEIDLPKSLESAPVPGLILQPLIENAIKHGVSRTSQAVSIRISAQAREGKLVIEVSDNGPGPAASASGESGIGLANVRDRLAARYGQAATLQCHGGDTGFRVSLSLPLERETVLA